jgi:hypothetical protein
MHILINANIKKHPKSQITNLRNQTPKGPNPKHHISDKTAPPSLPNETTYAEIQNPEIPRGSKRPRISSKSAHALPELSPRSPLRLLFDKSPPESHAASFWGPKVRWKIWAAFPAPEQGWGGMIEPHAGFWNDTQLKLMYNNINIIDAWSDPGGNA